MTGSDLGAGRPRSDEHRPSPKANTRQLSTPLERLAKRICHAANARGTPDVGPVVTAYKQRASVSFVNAAVDLAVAKQWLRFDGTTYTLTEAGTALGRQSRMGQRTRRVNPF